MSIIANLPSLVSSLICNLPLILLALVGVGFLIAFHELGHFLFAKIFNVLIPSFSIGFGPRIIEKKIGETTFALSAIPLGGYVELAGSAEVGQGEQAHAYDKSDRSFNAKPYWQKLLIMLGGILFNLGFAYFAFSLLFTMGAPCIGSWCEDRPALIGAVHPSTAAAEAKLHVHDKITAVETTATPTIGSVVAALKPQINKPTKITVERDGIPLEIEITPKSQKVGEDVRPLLGLAWHIEKQSISEAFKSGWYATKAIVTQTFGVFANIGKKHKDLGGPLMLICQVTQFAGMGLKMFLFMLAFISISLAVFNVLPLPIFDGGQVLFFTIEAILRRPLSDETRYKIHYYTWILMIGLVIYFTFKDLITIGGWF